MTLQDHLRSSRPLNATEETNLRWTSAKHIDDLEAKAHELETVLLTIRAEGLRNHNTRCRAWWDDVVKVLKP